MTDNCILGRCHYCGQIGGTNGCPSCGGAYNDFSARLNFESRFNQIKTAADCKKRIEAFGPSADLFSLHVEAARYERAHLEPLFQLLINVAVSADFKLTWSEAEERYIGNDGLARNMTLLRRELITGKK